MSFRRHVCPASWQGWYCRPCQKLLDFGQMGHQVSPRVHDLRHPAIEHQQQVARKTYIATRARGKNLELQLKDRHNPATHAHILMTSFNHRSTFQCAGNSTPGGRVISLESTDESIHGPFSWFENSHQDVGYSALG